MLAAASLVASGGVAAASPAAAVPVVAQEFTYTLDEDFDQGELDNVNHDAPNNDQLQLDEVSTFFPFVNIANSARGTASRIAVDTGAIVGEYKTAPDGMAKNPSRTTVDRFGNVWVTNRDEATGGKGSIARFGVVSGGTRSNADGTANPAGQYLKAPFAYSTCVDRDGDGLLRTSTGAGNILGWSNAGAADTNGGVSTAEDECVITYTRTAGTNARTVAVDANNDVWVGGFGNLVHEKLSGATGAPVPGQQFNLGCGGYGGLIDGAGILWSARGGGRLLRYDPATSTGVCLDGTHGDYGLGLDPLTGEIWQTFFFGNRVAKLGPGGNLLGTFAHSNSGDTMAQGVAVDRVGNVWVAHSLNNSTTVGHLRTDGTFVGNVTLPGGNGPTGVAVDANGKVWVANINSNNAQRIDPAAGPVGGGGFPVGAVDLTVDLGAGSGPYNYSDMTGSVLGEITAPQGTWKVVQDGGTAGLQWGRVSWNSEPEGNVPLGASLTVAARAADSEGALASQAFTPVTNGSPFSLTGRYLEVVATFTPNAVGDSPVLSDITIQALPRISVNDVTVAEGDAGFNNATFTVSLSSPAPSGGVAVTASTVDATATAPADYLARTGVPIIFAPGESTRSFTVKVVGDLLDEPTETFLVVLSGAVNGTIFDGTGVGTIIDDERNGRFSCRASALRLLSTEPAVANPANLPCLDDAETLANVTLGAGVVDVTSGTLSAKTNQTPNNLERTAPAAGDKAVAEARIEHAQVSVLGGLVTITATALEARARVTCVAGPSGLVPTFTSSSTVGTLDVNGIPVILRPGTFFQLPLGLGAISVRSTITGPSSVTQQAVRIEVLGVQIVLAEAKADFTGDPCAQ